MILKSKKLILRLFTVLLMAATIGITYPGYQASAGPLSNCLLNCGSVHQTVQQCYQQAICKNNCRRNSCQDIFRALCLCSVEQYEANGCSLPTCDNAYFSYQICMASASSSHQAAISSCDRLYWEHCPSPE